MTTPSQSRGSVLGPDLWFLLPPGFRAVELNQSTDARVTQLAEVVSELLPKELPEQQLSVVISGAYMLELMIGAGAVHLSTCLYREGVDDGFTQGILAVFLDGQGWPDRGAVARRTAVQWTALTPDAEIAVAEAPYGPVAIRAYDEQIAVPGFMYGLAEDQPPTTIRRLELAVPLLPGDKTALFVFMTEDTRHWNDYLSIVMGIVGSLSSYDPDQTGESAAEPEGA